MVQIQLGCERPSHKGSGAFYCGVGWCLGRLMPIGSMPVFCASGCCGYVHAGETYFRLPSSPRVVNQDQGVTWAHWVVRGAAMHLRAQFTHVQCSETQTGLCDMFMARW